MQKTKILTALLVIIMNAAFAQTKYFKAENGNIVDSIGYNQLKSKVLAKLLVMSKEMKLHDTFEELYKNGDSIVYSYSWEISNDNEKEFSKIKNAKNLLIGKEFPIQELFTINGEKVDIEKLKGKPTLINFWFTNCAPCVDEIPVLNLIKNKYSEKVNFLAITFDKKEKVLKLLKRKKFNFTHITDAKNLTDKLDFKGYPVNIFLDKNGVVTKIENGIPYTQDEDKKLKIGDGKEFLLILEKLL